MKIFIIYKAVIVYSCAITIVNSIKVYSKHYVRQLRIEQNSLDSLAFLLVFPQAKQAGAAVLTCLRIPTTLEL